MNSRTRQRTRLFDATMLGVAGAVAAVLFLEILKLCQRLFFIGIPELLGVTGVTTIRGDDLYLMHGFWWIPLVTTLGGLLTGFLVFRFAPETEGHGTDTAIRAFHKFGGAIRRRVPLIKLLASALTIGSGGAAGREGPTVLIGAGLGSLYARTVRKSKSEQRYLILVGMAAGLSAIFRSPIGAAFFAIEILYTEMEFESSILIYTLLSSIVSYALIGFYTGWEPLFHVPTTFPPLSLTENLWYIPLGILCGFLAIIVPLTLYSIRNLFRKLPISPIFRPAVGGLLVGLIALIYPQILAGGYEWIQKAVDGDLGWKLMLALMVAKLLAFSFTIGSGGSGGVFAPTLFIGAMMAGALGKFAGIDPAGFVIVGMTALFGGSARAPIAALLMVTEMTGGYHFLVPAALAVSLSYLVTELFMFKISRSGLYEAQVPGRIDSPAHHVEHIRTAFKILQNSTVHLGEAIERIDVVKLLSSGVPISLPGGQKIFIGILKESSPCVNQPIKSNCLQYAPDGTHPNIIAIIRRNEVLLPQPDLVLKKDDKIVLISEEEKWPCIAHHFEPLTSP